MSEVRRVLLANGQYIEIVQETGASTGSVMSQNAVTVALNGKANTTHTHAASDITSGTFSSARIANGAITKEKLADDIAQILYVETVIVTASSNRHTLNGFKVSINGVEHTFDSNGTISVTIPYYQTYSVTPVKTGAFTVSGGGTYTALTESRLISVTYNINSGIYIENTTGVLSNYSSWSSGNNASANSVVVVTENHAFKIALNTSAMTLNPDNTDPWENTLTGTTNETTAKADYNGAYNTQQIITLQPSADYAAGWCNAYTFPDGTTKGYLPALGEWQIVFNNKSAIDSALSKCGGSKIPNNSHWSSTFYGVDNNVRKCWKMYLNDGSTFYYRLDDLGYYVRPFAIF